MRLEEKFGKFYLHKQGNSSSFVTSAPIDHQYQHLVKNFQEIVYILKEEVLRK